MAIDQLPCDFIKNLAPRQLVIDGVEAIFSSLPCKPIDQTRLAKMTFMCDLDPWKQDDYAECVSVRRAAKNAKIPPFHKSDVADKRATFIFRSLIEDPYRPSYTPPIQPEH